MSRLDKMLLLGVILCVLLSRWLPSQWMEILYGQGLFPVIRVILDGMHSWLPCSPLWICIPLYVAYRIWRRRSTGGATRQRRVNKYTAVRGILRGLGIIIILFYVLWGFNYSRPDLSTRLGFTSMPPDEAILIDLFYEQMDALIRLERYRADSMTDASDYDALIRRDLSKMLDSCGYRAWGTPQIRSYILPGAALRWGTAGHYMPWVGEGYYDPGLHALQQPYVIAHELSHAYGVSDEGEANFWALRACLASESGYIRYAGHLALLRYVLRDLSAFPETYRRVQEDMYPRVRADFKAIRRQLDLYPDIAPALRDAIYGQYLKSQGISSGLDSYGEVMGHYISWRARQG